MAAAAQTYATHRKLVPVFHFFVLPILFGNVAVAIAGLVRAPGWTSLWALLVAMALLVGVLYGRVFALGAQDRVIRLEERLRMREVLPADLQARIPEVTREQIIALRFASDDELPALVDRVLRENLQKREAIKKLVTQWRADLHQL